jgi:nucleoside-diphosphate-sugar epimerase
MAAKPRVIVLGGCGFIGRNLVHYLVTNDLCEKIRIIDKVLPDTAYLDAAQKASFENPVCEFMQGNLVNAGSIERCFTDEGGKFQFAFNVAGETKYGQVANVYKEKVLDLSVKCATEAAKQGVERFIEVSTGQVYDPNNKPKDEKGKQKPWTQIAEFKKQAEEALNAIEGLNVVFVRPAIVYGPGDIQGISPRIICGAVYKQLNEKMEFLWTADLRMNTVHVRDVAKALWHLTTNGDDKAVYNLCDSGETTQGKVNGFIEKLFGIQTGFAGKIKSNLAQLNLKGVTEDVNDKHLKPWSDLCKASGIDNTPLTPYLDEELLRQNHVCLNGSAIEATGFAYEYPAVTEELIREQVAYFTSQGIFPESVLA